MSALEALLRGDVDQALPELLDEVRAEPEQPRHRIFLFQLFSILGEWERALTQLNVARDLDPSTGVMAKAYQEFLQSEALRQHVFDGSRTPLIFGDPDPWLAQLVEALHLAGRGENEAAQELRRQAFQEAPAVGGMLTVALRQAPKDLSSSAGKAARAADAAGDVESIEFEWIADGDTRLGPVLEMIVNGRYYWAPFHRIAEIVIEPPSDLRDFVWTPAHFRWTNGGEAAGVIPTRYVGSEAQTDGAIRLARKTDWRQTGPESYEGLGQRAFVTDEGDYGLLNVRRIQFGEIVEGED